MTPRAITVRTGCRVDLAGGTLDIWPLGQLHPGARTVNVAVDVPIAVRLAGRDSGYAVVQGGTTATAATPAGLLGDRTTALPGLILQALDVPPVTLSLESGSPLGGGLGASSALAAAMIVGAQRYLGRESSPPLAVAALARDVEARLMELPTGNQDHFPPLLGGVLEIRYELGETRVRRLDGPHRLLDLAELGASMTVVYTGQGHFSAGQNWKVVRRRLDGDPEVRELLAGISKVAKEVATALEGGDLAAAGAGVRAEWELRSQLAPGISTPGIESLLTAAREAGAWGGKACGAGGGGCVMALGPPERQGTIAQAMEAAGGKILQARPMATALQVETE